MKNEFIKEIYRKLFHLLILLIPAIYLYFGKWQSLQIFAILTSILIISDLARNKFSKYNQFFSQTFGALMRQKEINNEVLFCGTTYVGIAACVCFALFKPEFAICGFIILTISDSIAAIIGKSVSSKEFFEKSSAGSLAFFISALLVLIICGLIFDQALWFFLLGPFAVFVVTMFEARPSLIKLDDNLAIPLGFSSVMTLFDVILNYQF